MSSASTRLVFQTRPGVLSPEIQDVVLEVERQLQAHTPARVLVTMEPGLHTRLLFTCIERLLWSCKNRRVLLLTPTLLHAQLVQAWQTLPSSEDGCILSRHFPLSCSPLEAASQETRICIAALRETQLQQRQQPELFAHAFDVVLAYGVPATFSPVWQQVLEHFSSASLLGFCTEGEPVPAVLTLFHEQRITYVAKQQTSPKRNARYRLLRFFWKKKAKNTSH